MRPLQGHRHRKCEERDAKGMLHTDIDHSDADDDDGSVDEGSVFGVNKGDSTWMGELQLCKLGALAR